MATGTEPGVTGEASAIKNRGSLVNQQDAAPRADDLTLDPKYKGFTRIPNTKVLIKFNAKPRTDVTFDTENAGDDNRFVTAKIPVTGQADKGGDPRFNINAKGSQLRIDVRAPEVAGKPRFYYENDFYGSGGGEFPYRIRHLYGQYYNIIVGQTFSVFEDPDVWPDTVDYEGPELGDLRAPAAGALPAAARQGVAAELRHRAARVRGRHHRRPDERAASTTRPTAA